LQEKLNVKVHNVLWGHPNLRGQTGWAKEHRIRIFADDFQPIGYGFGYKQELLNNLILMNRKLGARETSFCNPKIKKVRRKKDHYKDERSKNLPPEVRKHFNSYFDICLAIGCKQGKHGPQAELFEEDDDS
jgi:hypothetical protein